MFSRQARERERRKTNSFPEKVHKFIHAPIKMTLDALHGRLRVL